jgi:hypothetical protein
VRQCYKWQVGQPKVESWAGRLKEELDTVGLGCIWQNEGEKEMRTICHITKTRCLDSHDRGC